MIVEDPTTPKALPCEIMAFKNFTDQRRGNDSHKNIHADFVEPGINADDTYYVDVLESADATCHEWFVHFATR